MHEYLKVAMATGDMKWSIEWCFRCGALRITPASTWHYARVVGPLYQVVGKRETSSYEPSCIDPNLSVRGPNEDKVNRGTTGPCEDASCAARRICESARNLERDDDCELVEELCTLAALMGGKGA
jgi:hypothetical protein